MYAAPLYNEYMENEGTLPQFLPVLVMKLPSIFNLSDTLSVHKQPRLQ